MNVEPLSSSAVATVLNYICPLNAPLPPHILSKPLLQRHHFMHLTPDNPLHYLAWPPHDDDLLDHLDISEHSSSFSVRYSADNQHIIAHARVTPQSSHHPGIRLIFLWDAEQSSWQYHNLAPMPFPKDSHSALRDAVAIHQSSCDFLPDPPNVVVDSHDNDDSYWNSYSQTGDGPPPALDSKPDHHLNSEDAYWAQYATVQGMSPVLIINHQLYFQQVQGTLLYPLPSPISKHLFNRTSAPIDVLSLPVPSFNRTRPNFMTPSILRLLIPFPVDWPWSHHDLIPPHCSMTPRHPTQTPPPVTHPPLESKSRPTHQHLNRSKPLLLNCRKPYATVSRASTVFGLQDNRERTRMRLEICS
jgi:hypothetical protein